VTNQLKVVLAWVKLHEKVLERFASQSNFGYEHFIRSNAYATVFTAVLGMNINP